MSDRLCLVTGASGFIGAALVPALLEKGWRVRVLSRSPQKLDDAWRDRVEVSRGDAADAGDVAAAMKDVDVAYFLLHSMDGQGHFVERDRQLATTFATAAREAGVGRVVYLSGLHPPDEKLSEHLGSRVEVGEILLKSGVPTAVLQAGVVLGKGSASFDMLRHLTERLPISIGPRWLTNRIQPIAIDDVVYYLAAAAELDPTVNRTIDIGMDAELTYVEMMKRYARVTGLTERHVAVVPVLTPQLASYWVGLVTPVSSNVARPLVGSLVHDAVRHEHDAEELMGEPEGGRAGFDHAVRLATADVDPHLWGRTALQVGLGVVACVAAGSLLTDPDSAWYRRLRKPRWQPPAAAFPIVWTTLYGTIAAASTAAIHELSENGRVEEADDYRRALAVNLILNATWSGVFFRAHALKLATAAAVALAASSADLARRAAPSGPGKVAGLTAYAAWCAFASVLSGELARRNGRSPRFRGTPAKG